MPEAFPTEREVKFVPASAGALLRLKSLAVRLGATPGPARFLVLEDVYLDSPDHWLWRAGLGLRVRIRPDSMTLTLKAARGRGTSAVLERPEIEEPLRRLPARFPCAVPGSRIAAWIRQVAGPLRLVQVARLRLRRLEYDAAFPGGLRTKLCADAVLAEAGGHRVRFWEAEVESTGPGGDLERLARRLADLSGWRIVPESKLERALALADVPAPALDETDPNVDAGDTCAEAAHRVLRRHWKRYVWNEPGTRAGLDPEALHDMRVAARRLRAAGSVFDPCLPAAARRQFGDLRWIAASMGRARDLDVEIENLRAAEPSIHPRHWPAIRDLTAHLERRRETARRALLRALGSDRHRAMVAGFDRMLDPLREPAAGGARPQPVDRVAARCLRARARKVARSLRELRPDSPDEVLHALRILIKKLRYAIEFFGPVLGRQARKAVAPLVRAQDLLGAHQDAAVMCDLLARLAAKRPSDAPLQGAVQALTLLYRQRQREQRAALPETMSGDLFARIERLAARR